MTSPATIVLCLLCLGLAGWGWRILVRHTKRIHLGIRARAWPQTFAKIKHSRLVQYSSSQSRGGKVVVRYLYEVNGTAYNGDTIHPCYPRGKGVDYHSHATLDKVRMARRVRVYYDPLQPSRSMLCTGFYPASLFPILGGLFAILPGAGVALWLLIKFAGWQASFEVMTLAG